MRKNFFVLTLLFAAAGCAINVPPPQTVREQFVAPEKAWDNVLSRFVDERGRINFAGIAKSPSELEAYVANLATVSPASAPQSFPTRETKLAYYINAYNALAMYNVVRSGIPANLGSKSDQLRFFYRTRFKLGGDWISLYDLENKVIRPMGEPRIHFALNCMARGCPRLPREPFRAETLEKELEREAKQFFNEERNVQENAEKKAVRLSEILSFYKEDFLKAAPSLIAYANRYREEKIPEDYKVEFIPYDWTVNKQ